MEFTIGTTDLLDIKDSEISELLTQVYVTGGFTEQTLAATLFNPCDVRKRGILIGARESNKSSLAGIVILVPPSSPACRLAKDNEAEIHLLGVQPCYRNMGLGRKLIEAATQTAQQHYNKIILWTQVSMIAAQSLYESLEFNRTSEFTRNGYDFICYEKLLTK